MNISGAWRRLTSLVFRNVGETNTTTLNPPAAPAASRTITLPDASTTLVGTDTAQTLTNKGISGSTNTITGVPLTTGVTGVLPQANGGTGQNSTATFPVSGVLVTEAGTQTLTNKTITSPLGIAKADVGLGNVDNTSDATKDAATATLSNKTLLTPVIDDYFDLNEEAAPSTPASGKVRVYAKTDNKLYLKDDLGTETAVGSGGAGEINAITTGSSDATGWTSGTSHTAATDTSNSPLSPVVTTAISALSSAAVSLGSQTSTSGVYKIFTLPTGLENKKLKVEFYFTSPAAADGTWAVSVYNATTRVPLSTDSSGDTILPSGVTGKFTAYFDTDSNNSYSVNIVQRTRTNANTLYLTSVVVGPGIQPQGAVVGAPLSYTPTTSLTNTTMSGWSQRSGQFARLKIQYLFTGAPSGSFQLSQSQALNGLGLTYDTSLAASTEALAVGSWAGVDAGVETYGGACYIRSDGVLVLIDADGVGGVTSTAPFSWNSGDKLIVDIEVPIAEWAGSGTVNLAQNDVEYASNSSATDADDTTSFVYGPNGSVGVLGTTNLTATRSKRIRFQTPIQVGDKLDIEIKDSTGAWLPHTSHPNGSFAWASSSGGTYSGILLDQINSTDVDVTFYVNPTQFSSSAWASQIAGGWRVRKSSAGAAVGFGIVVPGTSSGLVSASGLPGNTTGSAIATGYVGEYLTASAVDVATNTGGFTAIGSLTLTAGVWIVSATSESRGAVTQTGAIHVLEIKGTAGTTRGKDYISVTGQPATASHMITFAAHEVVVASGDSNKTVRTLQQSQTAAGLGCSYITAVRIA